MKIATLVRPSRAVVAAVALGIGGSLVFAPAANAAIAKPDMNQVSCGTRTDWLRLWTAHHGYPICYANNGMVYYGDNPPKTTWTSYGVCFGNNSGWVKFYYHGNDEWEDFKSHQCDNWSSRLGTTVEVAEIEITGR
ncbi:MAG: hypothetical protein HOW97_10985 [Catenulispora sp.]|nr:hypothetical protein [Catenulispora sp.]